MGQASQSIQKLLTLAPNLTWRLRDDGTEEQVALESIMVGNRLRVKPGEMVPVPSLRLVPHWKHGTIFRLLPY